MGRVYHHEIGKRHTNNMANSGKHAFATEEALQIAPGEPIPPGFEGEIKKVAMIQVICLFFFKFSCLMRWVF